MNRLGNVGYTNRIFICCRFTCNFGDNNTSFQEENDNPTKTI